MDTQKKIDLLQNALKTSNLDAYIIPSGDPHQSEYLAGHWKGREWISGFTGSAGTVVITQDHAGLWTDSRYFIQAEEELADSDMILHKLKVPHSAEHISWLKKVIPAGSTVACDGILFSYGQITKIKEELKPVGINVKEDIDLLAPIWTDRPSLPLKTIFEHDIKFASISRNEKIEQIRTKMKEQGAKYHWISTLDDIAWTLNIRSSDVECNPVSISYLMIGLNKVHFLIEKEKVNPELVEVFKEDNIHISSYNGVLDFINAFEFSGPILVNPSHCNYLVYSALKSKELIEGPTIPLHLKAIKNEGEIKHIKNAMIKDGVALTKLFRWLFATVKQRKVKETEVAKVLANFRSQQADYFGESFDAIVGYNGNGAIVHYHAKEETCAEIEDKGILLLDSGGQYFDGTTDVTRTVAIGEPTEEQKTNFTLVLKGHIQLDSAVFPKGTMGLQLDAMARMHLWKARLNYGHGTGHGVGFFLNVHEPPQGFAASAVTSRGVTPILEGTLTSNEPGFYKTGEYGIRIENLVVCKKVEENEFGTFLGFEPVTLFPIDQKLIQHHLLTKAEVNWLNNYHEKVQRLLSEHLDEDEKKWMKEQCKSI